ncbi:MAG: penicillin-binding protein 2 [Nevskia sp.]|nr:penicillin-binding protein 2 [Nevskia sp.]
MSAAFKLRPDKPGNWRRQAALGLMAVFAVAVLGRAFYLQVVENDFLTREGNRRQVRTVALQANRGAVRDRNGEPLALSAPVDSIWVVPSDLLDAPPYVVAMSKLLGVSSRELEGFLRGRSDRQFVYLKRQIDPDEAKRFMALGAPGVFSQREYRRYYPAGEVAAHVVGFCDIDGKGQEGIEAAQDAAMRGTPGSRRVIRDRAGHVIEDTDDYTQAQPGQDVNLTLDLRLQYLAYRELKSAVESNQAKGGLIVVADARSGDILALASQPGYNPNRADDRDSTGLRNRAVVDSFEPGSTIKPLLISQALETRAIPADIHIDTGPGYFKVGALTVHDVHPEGEIDLALLLAKSSNVGAAKVGLIMGPESVWTGYQKFGIGEPVGSGLPGEASGVLRKYNDWGQIATATASYGYGLTVNALQLVRAYTGIANDGLMPQLSILHRDHEIPAQRVISAQTARTVRQLLEGVVNKGGSAVRGMVAGYRVAGKTGTVRKNANGSYIEGHHQAVFIGMLPAEHPRLVSLVMIDDPSGDDYYGGAVSAPVFARVMAGAARLLQIPPDMSPQTPQLQTAGAAAMTAAPGIALSTGVRP